MDTGKRSHLPSTRRTNLLITLKRFLKPRYLIWLVLLPLIVWALRDIPLQEVWDTLKGLSWGQIAFLAILNTVIVLLLSSRWWLLLRSLGHTLPYSSLVAYRQAAFGVSYFTPGPQFGGEPLQVYLTRNRHSIPGALAIAAVSLDKLLELIANFTFLAFGVFTILRGRLFGSLLPIEASIIAVGLLCLPLIYLFALWFGREPLSWFVEHIPTRYALLPRVRRIGQAVTSAEAQAKLFCQKKPLALLQAMLLSLLIWAVLVAEYWLALNFLGAELNLLQTIGVMTLARLAFLSPMPAGLGTLEASQVLAMGALGLNPALGLSISLLIRARDIIFASLGLLLGLYLYRYTGSKPVTYQAGD